MISGFILLGLFLLLCMKFITKRCKNRKLDMKVQRLHKILGIVFLITTVIHMTMILPVIRQRPISMILLGFVMLVCALGGNLSFLFREKLKKQWIVIHRVSTVILLIAVFLHIYQGIDSFRGYKNAVQELQIGEIDLREIADGIYLGECNVGYIYAKVRVTIQNHQYQNVELMEHRNERGKSAEYIPSKIKDTQSNRVDAVSGATNSSKVIMKAVENALKGNN